MSKNTRFLVVAVGMVFSLLGCSGSNFNAVFVGPLSGTYNSAAMTGYNFRATVHQTGSTVYGDWNISQSTPSAAIIKAGSLTGPVNGTTLTATLTSIEAVPNTYNATIIMSGTAATMTISGGTQPITGTATLVVTQ